MNLQRREEIRRLRDHLERDRFNGMTSAMEDRSLIAINELLAHVDTLEQAAAERVIADGSRGPTPDYTGEGMVAVDREELELLRRCEKHLRSCKAVYDLSDRGKFAALDALRANQGEAAT